jgi:hypothetical protein
MGVSRKPADKKFCVKEKAFRFYKRNVFDFREEKLA